MPRWKWLRTATRLERRTPPPDTADMGTAYGLDASFRDLPEAPGDLPAGTAAPRLSHRTGLPRRD